MKGANEMQVTRTVWKAKQGCTDALIEHIGDEPYWDVDLALRKTQ